MEKEVEHTLHKPEKLPFLEAVCWDLGDVNLLTQDEILDRYERGWVYKDVLAAILPQEKLYIASLAKAKGSWLQLSV